MKTLVIGEGAAGKAIEALVKEKHEVTVLDMDSCATQKNKKLFTVPSYKAFGIESAAATKEGGEKLVGPEI